MVARCINLNTLSEGALQSVGGKAANLIRLIDAGMPVPPGFVVPVSVYDEFFSENGLEDQISSLLENTDFDDEKAISLCSRYVKENIMGGRISADAIHEILDILSGYDAKTLWAVRSSAVAEDLPEASFAGQQDTYLNVTGDDVTDAIKKCWASYWNSRAMAYRHHSHVPQLESGIAVVVQKMVDARCSGVMFTADPVKGDFDTVVVESSWGLGESIVSGIVSPDRFTCRRDGSVIDSKISKKAKGIFLAPSQNSIVDIAEDMQMRSSLAAGDIKRLVAIGMQIEAHFKSPQDIEWSIEGSAIYILQSRPITTLTEQDGTLWTRAYGDEYWADATSPLFFSLMGEYLTDYVNHEGARIMGYSELAETELLRLHKAHIYFNSSVLESTFTYNPKFSRTKELLNYFPEGDQERIADAKTKVFRRLLAETRILLLDPDGVITRTDAAYKRWAAGFLESMQGYDSLDLSTLSDKGLYDEFLRMEKAYIKHYRLIRYGMVTHSIGSNLMIKRWLQDWLGDTSGELYSALISGLPENKTIQTNRSLAELTRALCENGEFKELLATAEAGDIQESLKTEKFGREHALFESFMDDYGHRSHTRELYFPRWRDDPTLVLSIIRSLSSSPDVDFEKMEKTKVEQRLAAQKSILERIGGIKYGTVKKPLFKTVMHYAQKYLIFRENQRFYLDHQLYRLRRLFLEYGRRLAQKGAIDAENDVFFLSKEEVFGLMGEKSYQMEKEVVEKRKSEFFHYMKILPPKFLRGTVEFDDTLTLEEDVTRITGTSASPGIFTGRIRVITTIDELGGAKENEILVTSNTDPGWTPVFAKLGGLITETGGILSHGAVVSREYGIPAVTAVKNATQLLTTGQMVKIDGNEGTLYVLEE